MSKDNTSTWATHTIKLNKQNAKSMIKTYQSELDKTPLWRIFKRHQLKKAIKLWKKVGILYGNR